MTTSCRAEPPGLIISEIIYRALENSKLTGRIFDKSCELAIHAILICI